MSTVDAAVRQAARDMHADGASIPQIASELGVAYNTARRWVSEEYAERQARYQRERRAQNPDHKRRTDRAYYLRARAEGFYGTCEDCGENLPKGNKTGRCIACFDRESAARATRAVAMWVTGAQYPEIIAAEYPGLAQHGLGQFFVRLRAAGYPVPRRKPGGANPPVWVDPLPTEPIVIQPGWSTAYGKAA